MPSEPEKKIEPLLGAYAARRREAAGPGGTVPPAVRQAWRAEVRRRWPQGASASKPARSSRPWIQVLASLWPRLAMAGGLAFVLAASVWWLMPRSPMAYRVASAPPSSAQPADPVRSLSDAVKPSAEAARPAVAKALPPSPASATAGANVAQPNREEKTVELGLSRYAAAPPPPASVSPERPTPRATPPAAAPTSAPRSTPIGPVATADTAAGARPALARPPTELAAADTRLKMDAPITPGAPPNSRPSLVAAPAEPTELATASRGGLAATSLAVQSFRNVPSTRPAMAGGTAVAPGAETRERRGFLAKTASQSGGLVLANFTVEQSGSSVRLVDADGSVYEGRIVSTPAIQTGPMAPTRDRRAAAAGQRQTRAGDQTLDRLGAATSTAIFTNAIPVTVAFEAIGTNTTLRQPVRLTGELYLEPGPSETAAQALRMGAAGMNQLKVPGMVSAEQSSRPGQAPQAIGGQSPAQTDPQSPMVLQFNAGPNQIRRITGQARFGRTNAIAIDAVPDQR